MYLSMNAKFKKLLFQNYYLLLCIYLLFTGYIYTGLSESVDAKFVLCLIVNISELPVFVYVPCTGYILVSLNPVRYLSVDARFVLLLKIKTEESPVLMYLPCTWWNKCVCAERTIHCSVILIFHNY